MLVLASQDQHPPSLPFAAGKNQALGLTIRDEELLFVLLV
jgi:hypothetical protein